MKYIHTGDLIEERLKTVGMTKAEFGRRIQTSRQNVNSLLQKDSLDIKLLARISQVLGQDFVAEFLSGTQEAQSELQGAGQFLMVLEVDAEECKMLMDQGVQVKATYRLPNGSKGICPPWPLEGEAGKCI